MIGLCINYFHENYGGMLQALSTVKMLEKRGLDYELIQYEKHYSLWKKVKQIPRLFNSVLINDKKEAIKKRFGRYKSSKFKKNDQVRLLAFDRFKKTYFTKLSPVFKGYEALSKGANRYSAVVTGSDQLWSPAGLPTNFYNLMFVPSTIRKISIASSFGVKDIPWYQKRRTRFFLNRIEYISMRENRGSKIVKELTGRTVETILDPVFLFNEQEWADIIPLSKEINEPYIFAYFLGSNTKYRSVVKEAAKELGCKIVTLRHLDQYIKTDEYFGDFAPYDVDPARFLNILRFAKYICTDSFHGTVLSIINHKHFVTFNRYDNNSKYSKNSRIDTLCDNLGIQENRFNVSKNILNQLVKEIDYNKIDEKLFRLKKNANSYFDNVFEGIS